MDKDDGGIYKAKRNNNHVGEVETISDDPNIFVDIAADYRRAKVINVITILSFFLIKPVFKKLI